MSTIIQSEHPMNHLPEIARNAAESAMENIDRFSDDAKKFAGVAVEAVGDAVDSGEDALKHASDTARGKYTARRLIKPGIDWSLPRTMCADIRCPLCSEPSPSVLPWVICF